MTDSKLTIGQAIDQIVTALSSFDDPDKETILRTVRSHLKLAAAHQPAFSGGVGRAVTVSGTHPETEDGLIGQRQWQDLHERHASGQTISAIARDLDLDRKTVRTCLRQACWTPYQRSVAAGGLSMPIGNGWLNARRRCTTRRGSSTRS